MKGYKIILPVLAIYISYVESSEHLRCWHCVAGDCSSDPSDNYKASEKVCKPGQSCQKVYFEMEEETDDGEFVALHTSTIRGCSINCKEKNDFVNCTDQLKTSRGCVRKNCCNDSDLCNNANVTCRYNLFCNVVFLMCLLTMFRLILNENGSRAANISSD